MACLRISEKLWLFSFGKASYITGTTLRIDGGLILPGMPEHVLPEEDFNGWSKAHSLFAEEVFKRIV